MIAKWYKSADDDVLGVVANKFPGLISLDLSSCDKITDEGLEAVAEQFLELTTLSLGYCEEVTVNGGLKILARKFPNLTINVGSNDEGNFGEIGDLVKDFPLLSTSNKETYVDIFRELARKYPKFISSNFTSCNEITDEGMEALAGGCRKLQIINFGFCSEIINYDIKKLDEEGFSKLPSIQKLAAAFSKLPSLDLSELDITDIILSELTKQCSKLESIELHDSCQFTDNGIKALVKTCPNLTNINLADCEEITDAAIEAIVAGCRGLKSLNVACCAKITDAAIVAIAKKFSELTSLTVLGCAQITDTSWKAISDNCHRLKSLNVACCNITDADLQAIARGCPELESLDLGGCKNLSIAGIEAIVKGCPKLSSLVLPDNTTDAVLKLLASECPNLTNIDLSIFPDLGSPDKITDEGVLALAGGCSKLKTIGLIRRQNITDKSLQALAECKDLTQVRLFGNKEITANGVKSLVLNPNIKIPSERLIRDDLHWPDPKYVANIRRDIKPERARPGKVLGGRGRSEESLEGKVEFEPESKIARGWSSALEPQSGGGKRSGRG